MRITASMALFWIAMALTPLVVSVVAIGIVPNNQEVVTSWDEAGLVHYGSPTKLMMVSLFLSAGNVAFGAGYLFNNNLSLPELIQGKDRKGARIICVAGGIILASAAVVIALDWSQALISSTY